MGLLDDIMADDAAFAFMDTDVFGEEIVYLPQAGGTRTIIAVVDRLPRANPQQPGGRGWTPRIRVTVRNDTTYGIGSGEYRQGDRVRLAERRGQSGTNDLVIMPSSGEQEWHDSAMCRFDGGG